VTTPRRRLHLSGPMVSAIGMGTWATGGPSSAGPQPLGWGTRWDRSEARAVLRASFDAGITVFDTADAYGTGTAERLIGEALGDVRDDVAIVSKWGNVIDEQARRLVGTDSSPGYVRVALDASLDRLRTDHIDLYLLHLSDLPVDEANELLGTLDDLAAEGKIGAYGWSTDDPALAGAWLGQRGFGAIEFEANVVRDTPELIGMCDQHLLPALVRGPLGTGLLTGAHPRGSQITDDHDFRRVSPPWLNYFRDGRPDDRFADRLEPIVDILTGNGRTIAQGALCWLLARSPHLIPIPGARTVAQAMENAASIEQGPLTDDEMTTIDHVLSAIATHERR
jgi:aryl-alcohol dehydrogenase-like predicted oxidoreductase